MHHNVKQRIRSRVYHSIMMPSSVRITRTKWRGREKKEGKGSTIIIDWLAILRKGRKSNIRPRNREIHCEACYRLLRATNQEDGNNNCIASIFHVFSSFVLLTRPGEFSLRPREIVKSIDVLKVLFIYESYVHVQSIRTYKKKYGETWE